jgi:acetyl-CoA acetyltransferase
MDLIEIQEAFAAQVLADLKQMGLAADRYDRVNVNGSGISLGHPIACTGTRVLVTLLHEMKRRNALRAGVYLASESQRLSKGCILVDKAIVSITGSVLSRSRKRSGIS